MDDSAVVAVISVDETTSTLLAERPGLCRSLGQLRLLKGSKPRTRDRKGCVTAY